MGIYPCYICVSSPAARRVHLLHALQLFPERPLRTHWRVGMQASPSSSGDALMAFVARCNATHAVATAKVVQSLQMSILLEEQICGAVEAPQQHSEVAW